MEKGEIEIDIALESYKRSPKSHFIKLLSVSFCLSLSIYYTPTQTRSFIPSRRHRVLSSSHLSSCHISFFSSNVRERVSQSHSRALTCLRHIDRGGCNGFCWKCNWISRDGRSSLSCTTIKWELLQVQTLELVLEYDSCSIEIEVDLKYQ